MLLLVNCSFPWRRWTDDSIAERESIYTLQKCFRRPWMKSIHPMTFLSCKKTFTPLKVWMILITQSRTIRWTHFNCLRTVTVLHSLFHHPHKWQVIRDHLAMKQAPASSVPKNHLSTGIFIDCDVIHTNGHFIHDLYRLKHYYYSKIFKSEILSEQKTYVQFSSTKVIRRFEAFCCAYS